MQILNAAILLLGAIQWVRTKSITGNTARKAGIPPEVALVQFYDEKLTSLAPEVCDKIDHLAKQMLKDETIMKAATPPILEFKRTIEKFIITNGFYKRFGLQEDVPWIFANKIEKYYRPKQDANKDFVYISELLETVGYNELRNRYKTVLMAFVSEEFLPKCQELKRYPSIYVEYMKNLDKWIAKLKECQEYECFLNNFRKSTQTTLDVTLGMILTEMFEERIIFSYNATIFAQNVVKDPQLLKLSTPVQRQLVQNLQELLRINETIDQPLLPYLIPVILYPILFKFDNYSSISAQDRQLLTKIFDDHDYTQLQLNRELKAKSDQEQPHDYLREYQDFIATKNPDDLRKCLDSIDNYRRANTPEERKRAINALDGQRIFQN